MRRCEARKKNANHDDRRISYHGVRQREGQHDLDLQWRDVAVRSDVVHRVQQPEITIHGFSRAVD